MYLDGRIDDSHGLFNYTASSKEEIKTSIVEPVQGMFLLAKLHLDSLVGKRSPKAIRLALKELPNGSDAYHQAYKTAMERIYRKRADQKELAMEVLSWMTCARSPLTTSEIQHALCVEVGETELDLENLSEISHIVSVWGGLVTVDEESHIIRLVHYTTQEYFEHTKAHWFPNAEAEITTICITYLSFDVFEKGRCLTGEDLLERFQRYRFYKYAARIWGHHARAAVPDCTGVFICFLDQMQKVEAAFQVSKMIVQEEQEWFGAKPAQLTGLHYAAYHGVTETVAACLQKSVEIDTRDADGRTPLCLAATEGYEPVVKLLLDNGAGVDSEDQLKRTPLSHAAEKGHGSVIMMLFRYGASVDLKDHIYGRTPLIYAIQRGDEANIALLICRGANVDLRDTHEKSPLSYAAEKGYMNIFKLLLAKGADVGSQSIEGKTPIYYALSKGHNEITKSPISKGACAEPKTRFGFTPLILAVTMGNMDGVKLLLENGAFVDHRTFFGWTPLLFAVCKGHDAILGTILSNNADPDLSDFSKRTPLLLAAKRGFVNSVKLLLHSCASVDLHDKDLSTPLRYAARNGYVPIVEILLCYGARVDLEDNIGRTPLSYAAAAGCESTGLEPLFEGEGLLDLRNVNEPKPLSRAPKENHTATIELLLHNGASVDSKDKKGLTPLWYASQHAKNGAVVELLLGHGADAEHLQMGPWNA